jgi:adenosylhomocysteine nucleosidase
MVERARSPGAFGLLCALPEELGSLAERVTERRSEHGLELLEIDAPAPLIACVAGVGKVRAAHGTAALLGAGAQRGILVVGVCGGLRRGLVPGTMIHCERAVQTDLADRSEREVSPDGDLLRAWRGVAPGELGWFLTADRPVLSLWRRLRLARAFLGPCAADMETAAAAAVARRAGVPWAALRAVTDQATGAGLASFKLHYPSQAGRAADTVPMLLASKVPAAGPVALSPEEG